VEPGMGHWVEQKKYVTEESSSFRIFVDLQILQNTTIYARKHSHGNEYKQQ
jgi:hypothetical protein